MVFSLHPKLRPFGSLGVLGAVVISFLFPVLSPGQAESSPEADPAGIVRRAVANHLAEEASHHPLRFALRRKDERHDITREIVETPQGDVALVVASNGAPLSPGDHQVQVARLDNLAAHPDLQAHRQKREQEDAARIDKLMRLLPDAFTYRYLSTDPCTVTHPPDIYVPDAPAQHLAAPDSAAQMCYHMSFTPNPHFDPPDTESKILRGLAGDIWMEKSHERLFRLDAHLITDVDFGWGIVGRLDKGGTIYLEQTDIGNHDWELTQMRLNLTGKLLMVKSLTVRLTEEMGRFAPTPPNMDYRQAIRMLESPSPAAPSVASK